MRNHKCGCNRNNCPICCNRRNAGPTGATGATGPCCTGPTGPAVAMGPCGSLTINFDPEFPEEGCQLVLFRFFGVQTLEEFLVSPTARGWLLTFDPALGDLREFKVTVSEQIQLGFSESPPNVLKYQRLPPLVPGGGGRILFWLEDTTTGQPVDPCCLVPPFTAYDFTLQECRVGFNFLFADNPLPSPCVPTPPPGILTAGGARTFDPGSLPEDRQLISRARRR